MNKALRQLNISLKDAVSYLETRKELGNIESVPSFKLNDKQYDALIKYVGQCILVTPDEEKPEVDNDKKISVNKVYVDNFHPRVEVPPKKIRQHITKREILGYDNWTSVISTNEKYIILEVLVKDLIFDYNSIEYKYLNKKYILHVNGISPLLNGHIEDKNKTAKLKLSRFGNNFVFNNAKPYLYLIDLNHKLEEQEIQMLKQTMKTSDAANKEISKMQKCSIENICFHNGFYEISIIDSNKMALSTIKPLIIQNNISYASFNILKKYFAFRLPTDMIIKYKNNKVIQLENGFKLDSYIKVLNDNVLIHGDWFDEIQNFTKMSLEKCLQYPQSKLNKNITLKNEYLDYLSGHQNSRKIIKVYEIFNGENEDAYIFALDINSGQEAVVFENINFARATEIWIVQKKNFDECVSLVFNYFTDYSISNKRLAYKRKIISPDKFKAQQYFSVDHDNLLTWIRALNNIVTANHIENHHLQFVPGLKIASESKERQLSGDSIAVSTKHIEIMKKLFDALTSKVGDKNVGTEIKIGQKRIDVVAQVGTFYDLYEIKTDDSPRECLRKAMGQIYDYAYFECKDNIRNLTIVGPNPITDEVDEYLSKLRRRNDIPIYYISI